MYRETRFYGAEQKKLLASLVRREDFSAEALFNTMASDNCDGFINVKSLTKFFRKGGFYASSDDVQAIVRRLDLNYDGVITREELAKYIVNASKVLISTSST